MRAWSSRNRTTRLVWIGQTSSYFALVILSLRQFFLVPAHGYLFVAACLIVGFLPAALLSRLWQKAASYFLVSNAVALISVVVFSLNEWTLVEAFLLAPVFSLLLRDRRSFAVATSASLAALAAFLVERTHNVGHPTPPIVNATNVLTFYLLTTFLIYLIVREVLLVSVEEARRLQTIRSLTRSVEARDRYTFGHSDRVAAISRLLAEQHPDGDPETAYTSGLIHDVGKLSVPDEILLKPGLLTDEEFAIIRQHPGYGADICESLGVPKELIAGVLHHHERWDGTGYPDALRGEEIPLVGRIVALADAIDAMASTRAYRGALDMAKVYAEVLAGSGGQFDPQLTSIASRNWERILKIQLHARDAEDQVAAGFMAPAPDGPFIT